MVWDSGVTLFGGKRSRGLTILSRLNCKPQTANRIMAEAEAPAMEVDDTEDGALDTEAGDGEPVGDSVQDPTYVPEEEDEDGQAKPSASTSTVTTPVRKAPLPPDYSKKLVSGACTQNRAVLDRIFIIFPYNLYLMHIYRHHSVPGPI